ncbi:Uncharacterized conserved protein [Ceraceosorus bombacis]|uniref:Protein arginine methyltransferase NDUFAF7 n=1 Tax=Ceraceosorus bombacis TaxID=401625 RepID=A0A0N7LAM9_9BASI|nr:Uncharacterized conserved protein [Ceraceosorus bombacis]
MSIATYMRTALLDPTLGYYASASASAHAQQTRQGESERDRTRDILGAKGDFITSPEICQIFGELLAVYLISRWQAAGSPSKVRLVELGPGRGTLLSDVISTFSRFPTLLSSLRSVHLVEASPGMMTSQASALGSILQSSGLEMSSAEDGLENGSKDEHKQRSDEGEDGRRKVQVEWFPRIEDVPISKNAYTMVLAHEFFDALPIHIFENTPKGLREVLVDVDRPTEGQSGVTILRPSDLQPVQSSNDGSAASSTSSSPFTALRKVLSPRPTPWSTLASLQGRFKSLPPGSRVEVSFESFSAARRLGEVLSGREARRLKEDGGVDQEFEGKRMSGQSLGGAGLIVDYGNVVASGDSWRAFKKHALSDPLKDAGEADLTANVDFAYLRSALEGTDARPLGPMTQSSFLQSLGLAPRLKHLLDSPSISEENKADIRRAVRRLIDQKGMGTQYKFLGIEAAPVGPAQQSSAPLQIAGDEDRLPVYPFEQ